MLGARIYDPIAGRFLSKDPIPQAINQYSYTLGNPVRFWDPTGLEGVPAGAKPTQYNSSTQTSLSWELSQTARGSIKLSIPGFLEIDLGGETKVSIGSDGDRVGTVFAPPDGVAKPADPAAQAAAEKLANVIGKTAGAISGGSGTDNPAFGSESGGNGSTRKGKDGPIKRKGGGGKSGGGGGGGSPGPPPPPGPPPGACGLGFEVVPLMAMWSILRGRNRVRRRSAANG